MKYDKYKKVDVPWLDEIPEHWEFERAKFYFESKKELNKDNKEKTIMSLTKKGVIDNDIDNPIGSGMPTNDYSKYQLLNKDDLVFNMLDLWYPAFQLARIGIIPKQCAMSPAYIRFCNRDKSVVDDYFAYYWYYGLYSQKVFKQLGVGVRESLNRKRLLDIKIAIPPIQEQKLIGNFLDERITKLDKLILNLIPKVSCLKKLKNSIITEIVTGKTSLINFDIDKDGNKVFLSYLKYRHLESPWLDEIPEEWSFFANKHLFKKKKIMIDDPDKYELLSLTKWGIRYRNKNDFSGKMSYDYSNYQVVSKGDLILCLFDIDMSAVFSDISEYDGMITAAYKNYNILKGDLRYFKYFFDWIFINRKYMYYSKNVRFSVAENNFNSIKTLFPPIQEQKLIGNFLDERITKLDKLINGLSKKIELLKQLKRSLISEVVTGKINILNLNTNHLDYLNNNIKEDK